MMQRPVRRADAVENRQHILEVARKALKEHGDASMHAIAKLAKVGQATLYRNFPTREALVLAIHREDVATLVAQASELVAQHTPAIALRRWLHDLAAFGQVEDGLSHVLRTFTCEQLRAEGFQSVLDAIDRLLRSAQASGAMRKDIDGEDFLALIGFIWAVPDDDAQRVRTKRLLDILLDSLTPCQGAAQPLT